MASSTSSCVDDIVWSCTVHAQIHIAAPTCHLRRTRCPRPVYSPKLIATSLRTKLSSGAAQSKHVLPNRAGDAAHRVGCGRELLSGVWPAQPTMRGPVERAEKAWRTSWMRARVRAPARAPRHCAGQASCARLEALLKVVFANARGVLECVPVATMLRWPHGRAAAASARRPAAARVAARGPALVASRERGRLDYERERNALRQRRGERARLGRAGRRRRTQRCLRARRSNSRGGARLKRSA